MLGHVAMHVDEYKNRGLEQVKQLLAAPPLQVAQVVSHALINFFKIQKAQE